MRFIKNRRLPFIILTPFLGTFSWLLTTNEGLSQDANIEELLRQGDSYEAQINTARALGCYQAVADVQPNNADVLVRIARQYRHLMADADSTDEKLRLGQTALKYGEKAAALAPQNADAQLSPAISYGKLLPLLGSREQAKASPLIKAAAENAVRLSPGNDLAWHVLGRWHRVVSEVGGVKRAIGGMLFGKLPDASVDEAKKCLQRAIQLAPQRLIHQVEIGRLYASLGDTQKARLHLEKSLTMPVTEKEDVQAKQDAKTTLAKL